MLTFHKDKCESALKDIISLSVFAFFRIMNIFALHHSKEKGTVTVDKTNSPVSWYLASRGALQTVQNLLANHISREKKIKSSPKLLEFFSSPKE